MKFLLNICDITGAVVSSKMTGDVRAHAAWTLKFFVFLLVISYLIVRV